MAQKEITVKGSSQEIRTFTDVQGHYSTAKQDLEQRIFRKNGFDDADKMFASHIDEGNWPYRSLIFDPRPYTVVLEKSGRLIGSKPKGRLVPREGGDSLGSYINNELLSFQWDDNARLGQSMISKWLLMDQGTRRYGTKFALCKWRWEQRTIDGKKATFYDGPDFQVANSRDCLANPSYSFINKWFQHREWVTLDELSRVNDAARTTPIYKNLDLLRDSLREEVKVKGDRRESSFILQNKSIRGLTDYLGQDEVYPVIELVTEYRPDRWITFTPRHGVIVRDIPNPYKHGEIPVVPLTYYPNEDDLYGVSELEPVAKQIRAINAHISAYSDSIALAIRPPVHVNPINVRMHTLEWAPEAKWLMNNPNVDVQQMKTDTSITTNFGAIYNVLVGSALNAFGENSQGISQVNPMQDNQKVTATEIRDSAFTRNVRDNMNQILLAEALKKQIMFWHSMNQQFLFSGAKEKYKIIRIGGREAAEFFQRQGLSDIRPTEQDIQDQLQAQQLGITPQTVTPGPRFAVQTPKGEVPKFEPDEMGQGGNLYVEEGDLIGNYDYIPDIESMKAPSDQDTEVKVTAILGVLANPIILQMLQAEGKKPKVAELLIKLFESTKVIKNADAYFEDLPQQNPMMGGVPNAEGQVVLGGGQTPTTGVPGQGNGGVGGMAGGSQAMAGGPNPQLMGGPAPV